MEKISTYILLINLFIRYLYFTDWGKNPRIERAWMDGQNRKVLIDRDLGWPNGLVIDKPTRRMIWADARMEVSIQEIG